MPAEHARDTAPALPSVQATLADHGSRLSQLAALLTSLEKNLRQVHQDLVHREALMLAAVRELTEAFGKPETAQAHRLHQSEQLLREFADLQPYAYGRPFDWYLLLQVISRSKQYFGTTRAQCDTWEQSVIRRRRNAALVLQEQILAGTPAADNTTPSGS